MFYDKSAGLYVALLWVAILQERNPKFKRWSRENGFENSPKNFTPEASQSFFSAGSAVAYERETSWTNRPQKQNRHSELYSMLCSISIPYLEVKIQIWTYYFSKSEWSVLLTQYCSGDKMEKNEMSGAYSAYGGVESCAQGFGGETWGKETTWETQT